MESRDGIERNEFERKKEGRDEVERNGRKKERKAGRKG